MGSAHISHRLSACLLGLALAQASTAADIDGGRGGMLYATHCIACHTSQIHWRDKRLATDWPTLENQVRRWQRNTGLRWNDEDIASVSRYLNKLYYHYPESGQKRSAALSGPAADVASAGLVWPGGRPEWKNLAHRK